MSQYRTHNWLDIKTLDPVFGVQAKEPGHPWAHIREGPNACLFWDEGDAIMFRDLLRLADRACHSQVPSPNDRS